MLVSPHSGLHSLPGVRRLISSHSVSDTNDPNLPSNFMSIMAAPGWPLFYAMFRRVGVFPGSIFSTSRSVKVQFQVKQSAWSRRRDANSRARCQPCQAAQHNDIGWFLLIGSPSLHWAFLQQRFLFRREFPTLFFLGFFFFGRSAFLILSCGMTAQIVAAGGIV